MVYVFLGHMAAATEMAETAEAASFRRFLFSSLAQFPGTFLTRPG